MHASPNRPAYAAFLGMDDVDFRLADRVTPALLEITRSAAAGFLFENTKVTTMKVRSSLRSLKSRHRDCQVVRRRGKVYVINKTDPRFKARAG